MRRDNVQSVLRFQLDYMNNFLLFLKNFFVDNFLYSLRFRELKSQENFRFFV